MAAGRFPTPATQPVGSVPHADGEPQCPQRGDGRAHRNEGSALSRATVGPGAGSSEEGAMVLRAAADAAPAAGAKPSGRAQRPSPLLRESMDFRTMRSEELEAALAVAGEAVTEAYPTRQRTYPDLFLVCCDGEQIVGICCGYPLLHGRVCVEEMRLDVIAFLAEYQRRGCGTRLLRMWEDRVRARGDWTIGLGPGADGFYVKMGCTAFEYAVMVLEKLPPAPKALPASPDGAGYGSLGRSPATGTPRAGGSLQTGPRRRPSCRRPGCGDEPRTGV
jgi:GNAT superfamily N-acetyltransferase